MDLQKKLQVSFKSNDVSLIFNRFQSIKLSDNAIAGPKSVCMPVQKATIGGAPAAEKGADGLQFSAVRTRKRAIFVQISEHFRRFPDLVRMPLRGLIYKERK